MKRIVTLPDGLREVIEQKRTSTFPAAHPNLDDKLSGYKTSGLDAGTDAAVANRIRQSKEDDSAPPKYLSHKEISEELDFLFDLLKYGYGAYQYFGGDAVFGAVKQLILAKLSRMDDPLDNDSYKQDLLVPCLKSVITDNHFHVGEIQLGMENRLYLNDEYAVHKSGNEYFTVTDGRAYKVLSKPMPTITRDGEFAWSFGAMRAGGTLPETDVRYITLEDIETKEEITRSIPIYAVSHRYRAELSEDFYAIKEINGITVLENRRLFSRDENDPPFPFSEFAVTGRALRDKPVLILDLRCNGGGRGYTSTEWVREYTGEEPTQWAFAGARLLSKTVQEVYQRLDYIPEQPCWADFPYVPPRKRIQNENLLIVLTDNAIGSAGEMFIWNLRQLENVLFVGTNTAGCNVCADVGGARLPVSRHYISFGAALCVRPDLSLFEGVGFMPDLWAPPGECLERVIKFAERYGTAEGVTQ